ncbi:hypothetical protein N0V93_003233 [Gnomoniopsis smithogilvyi]|uniref:Peptidase S8/S53 domain-containing protein n=1 Tax=Gnomoniopsis smithogilvyi TaxID=1191159 RepID=A0A9W9CYY3_9PEZI|nr:hypothetical protein N0V93_003233 [Gnomoniopsis smithogilvyi]
MKTENASERLHLSLIDLARNYENPNSGEYTFDERALGKGTWVVIINTGFNWEQFPEEFGRPDDPRPLRIWRVPSHVRNRQLSAHEVEAGYFLPEDDLDYGLPFEGAPEGHGTQTAMLAAGLVKGVAREAGLYMIKAGGAILNQEGEVIEEDICADALLVALHHVIEKLRDETLTKGKTVVVIDTLWSAEGMESWTDQVEQVFSTLDSLGVVVATSAGNDGKEAPSICTGSKGQLAKITSAGSLAVPITCYAMGKGVKIIDLSVEEDTKQDGTTFSVAIVGGLLACYLSHPDFPERFKWTAGDLKGRTVGNRIKKWLFTEGQGSYQRVSPGNILDEPGSDWSNYPIPARVNTAYNYAHGDQGRQIARQVAKGRNDAGFPLVSGDDL